MIRRMRTRLPTCRSTGLGGLAGIPTLHGLRSAMAICKSIVAIAEAILSMPLTL
jgi:hypothetical protein